MRGYQAVMSAPEFIFLNEQAVRVTSWKQDRDAGTIEFVVIARGERDRDQLLDMLANSPVMVRLGTKSAVPMDVQTLDTRSSGEGPGSIHRLEVSLMPEGANGDDKPAQASAEDNETDALHHKLDRIITLLTEIRDEIRLIK